MRVADIFKERYIKRLEDLMKSGIKEINLKIRSDGEVLAEPVLNNDFIERALNNNKERDKNG